MHMHRYIRIYCIYENKRIKINQRKSLIRLHTLYTTGFADVAHLKNSFSKTISYLYRICINGKYHMY